MVRWLRGGMGSRGGGYDKMGVICGLAVDFVGFMAWAGRGGFLGFDR